jgi:hypothetical protein
LRFAFVRFQNFKIPLPLQVDDSLSLNFYKHLRINQLPNLHHCCGRPDLPEKLAVSAANLLPVTDIDDVHARSDDILEGAARALQRGLNVSQGLNCLCVRVADADEITCGTRLPAASVAVVPETWIVWPMRTAREYPTFGSHGVPLEMFCLMVFRN